MTYCKGCLSKQQKTNELEEEITSLKGKLRYPPLASHLQPRLLIIPLAPPVTAPLHFF